MPEQSFNMRATVAGWIGARFARDRSTAAARVVMRAAGTRVSSDQSRADAHVTLTRARSRAELSSQSWAAPARRS